MESIVCQLIRNCYRNRTTVHYSLELIRNSPVRMIYKIPDNSVVACIAPKIFRLSVIAAHKSSHIPGYIPGAIYPAITKHISIIPFPDDIRFIHATYISKQTINLFLSKPKVLREIFIRHRI